MRKLFIIPARGGSKGIPGKNIRPLGGKPLIHHSLEYARLFAKDEDICLTTDSRDIADCARAIGYEIPFLRPAALAQDTSGSYEVLKHAVEYYRSVGREYDIVVLLQPTSPFREQRHLEEAMKVFLPGTDMVVSVRPSPANPYYNLFEEDEAGYLKVSKGDGRIRRRQDAPSVYEYNGSIYLIAVATLMAHSSFAEFNHVRKYVMEDAFSVDLDTPDDWSRAEYLLTKKG